MAKVEIYTKAQCSFCDRAKRLLQEKDIDYIETRVDLDPSKLQEMLEKSGGRRTVPQIIINDQAIGGFDELWQLETTKQLNELLK